MIEPMVKYCAGLDIHRAMVVATIISEDDSGEIHKETREYSSSRKSLLELGRWQTMQGAI